MEANIALGYKLKREFIKEFNNLTTCGMPEEEAKQIAETKVLNGLRSALDWKNKAMEIMQDNNKVVENWYAINVSYPRKDDRKPLDVIEQRNFIQKCHEFAKRKCMLYGEYCFEQKGETIEEAGWGIHAHFNMITKTAKAELLRDTLSTFKGMVAPQGIKIMKLKFKDDLARREQYIRGIKVGEKKQAAIAIDPIWRASLKLENIYQVQ